MMTTQTAATETIPSFEATDRHTGRVITWNVEYAKAMPNAGRWTHMLGCKNANGRGAWYTVWAKVEDGRVIEHSQPTRLGR